MADPTATERLVRDLETLTNNLEFAFSGSIKPTADPIRVLQIRYVVALSAIAAFLERCVGTVKEHHVPGVTGAAGNRYHHRLLVRRGFVRKLLPCRPSIAIRHIHRGTQRP